MAWYRFTKEALRKNVLRCDFRVYVRVGHSHPSQSDWDNAIKTLLTAAVADGLDVLGIVDTNPQIGLRAQEVLKQTGLDLWVIPGQEYYTNDKFNLVGFFTPEKIPENLDVESALKNIHEQGGLAMAYAVTKRKSQQLNKIKDKPYAPKLVEIFNAASGGFQDVKTEYTEVISSAATKAIQLDELEAFTMVARKDLEEMGLLPEGQGLEYTPPYMKNVKGEQVG